jgi:hypothetical protein
MVMDNKKFEKLVLTALYDAMDSQGIEVPENPVIEAVGPHISIKDGDSKETITVIYVVKPTVKKV